MLKYGSAKPYKTYDEQLEILKSRGLLIEDEPLAKDILQRINYYRFSAYSLTLRRNDSFYEGVTFNNVYELYLFDSCFRELALKYSQIVEVAFRSYISHYHSKVYGPLGYLEPSHFEDISKHAKFLVEIDKDVSRSSDVFIEHHRRNKDSVFPFWVIIEVTTFGTLSKFFKNMKPTDRTALSKEYTKYGRKYIENWLQAAVDFRNTAAHGGRFYNRTLMATPVKLNAKKYPGINNMTPFANIIAVCSLLPSDDLKKGMIFEIKQLFNTHPFALPIHLGFPSNWESILAAI